MATTTSNLRGRHFLTLADFSAEEITYLLHHGHLPNHEEFDELKELLAGERDLNPFLGEMMVTLAQHASPMSMLRTSISAISLPVPSSPDRPGRNVPRWLVAGRKRIRARYASGGLRK